MKKPWNLPAYPVWSLSSNDADGQPNMNICTYVSPVSMKPKEFMVALYYGTKTFENVLENRRGVLQLLSEHQHTVVRRLGKKSSKTSPKKMQNFLARESVIEFAGHAVLPDALGVIALEFYDLDQSGDKDHAVGLAKVVQSKTLHDGPALTTQVLQGKKIIL